MLKNPILLLVDNEFHILAARGSLFKHYGYTVALAANQKEAIDVLKHEAVCAMIVDHRILDTIDKDILDQVRRDYPATSRLMINEDEKIINVNQLIEKDIIDQFFENPCESNALIYSIEKLFENYKKNNNKLA